MPPPEHPWPRRRAHGTPAPDVARRPTAARPATQVRECSRSGEGKRIRHARLNGNLCRQRTASVDFGHSRRISPASSQIDRGYPGPGQAVSTVTPARGRQCLQLPRPGAGSVYSYPGPGQAHRTHHF
eukprot:gene23106-biopygen19308